MTILDNMRQGARVKRGLPVSVAAAGNSQGTATLLTGNINTVTASDSTKGVLLPSGREHGDMIVVTNTVAAQTLKVYPGTGGKINNLSANAAATITASNTGLFINVGGEDWSGVYNA